MRYAKSDNDDMLKKMKYKEMFLTATRDRTQIPRKLNVTNNGFLSISRAGQEQLDGVKVLKEKTENKEL